MSGPRAVSLAAVAVAATLLGVVLATALRRGPQPGQGAPARPSPPPSAPAVEPDFAGLAAQVVPAVVSVFATEVAAPRPGRSEPGDGSGLPPPGEPGSGEPLVRVASGSGFFISSGGEVLTNDHVIRDANRVEVELESGDRLAAEVVGRDPLTDLALLEVEPAGRALPALPLGSSAGLRVGEWVMVVGNPLAMRHTVTVGVVSATGRVLSLFGDRAFEDYIQTDAAINVGNSGGPVVNLRGEVVGVATAVSAEGQNLGFAVPVDIAVRILPQLRQRGRVVRGYLGLMVRDVDQRRQEAFALPDRRGAFVEEVLRGHAAEEAGLAPGDVILSLDGRAVPGPRQLIDAIADRAPGTAVELEVLRGGRRLRLEAELEERGRRQAEDDSSRPGETEVGRLGLAVRPLDARARRRLEDPGRDGVVVSRVRPASPADGEGLVPGDIVESANGAPVRTPAALVAAVAAVGKGGYLRLYVVRPSTGEAFFAIIRLE